MFLVGSGGEGIDGRGRQRSEHLSLGPVGSLFLLYPLLFFLLFRDLSTAFWGGLLRALVCV